MHTIEHWTMWKDKCALALCGAEAQSSLRAFAHARFHKFASAFAKATNAPDPNALTPSAAETWHWFETYLRLRNTGEGKSYKHWLFARGGSEEDATLDRVQGGATLLMRDVVRERLRREFSSRKMVSLDAPIGTGHAGDAADLHELLPGYADTAKEVEEKELRSMAVAEADGAIFAMSFRERVALLARELGLSLAHPSVTSAADCGKSVLSTAYHDALQGVATHVKSRFPRDDRTTLALLTVLVFEEVKKSILLWGKSEKACAQLFLLVSHT